MSGPRPFANLRAAGLACGLALLASAGPALAAGYTHPGCPLCPGGGYSVQALERAGQTGPGRGTLPAGRVFNTLLIAPGSMSEVQNSVRVGVTSRLEVGATYLVEETRFLGQANYVLLAETGSRPGLTAGVGIDRPGGHENATFLILSKALEREVGAGWSAYAGASRRRGGDVFFVGGAAKVLSPRWAATAQYDGDDAHLGLQTRLGPVNVSLLWLRLEDVGGAIGVSLR